MESRVVALVVATDGGNSVALTRSALANQTRAVDQVIVVDEAKKNTFVAAIRGALQHVSAQDEQLFWLLEAGSAPAPTALASLTGALEVAPSVAVVGPKIMQFEAPDTIASFGLSMSRFGRTISLVSDELDQGQHDRASDVLAVDVNGMLVRDPVLRALGGFDAALAHDDGSLDFCIRARLAGHRVEVVPGARIVAAEAPSAGEYRARARAARQARAAQLHRRLAYARGFGSVWHWLGLLPNALWRTIVLLVGKRPTAVGGELSAAILTFVTPASAARARRTLRKTKTMPWSSLDSLILPWHDVRRRDALARETLRIQLHGQQVPTLFLATGGAWVLLGLSILSIVLMIPLIGAMAIGGGALLPLAHSVPELWSQVGFGWRAGTLASLGPADPFAFVVAILGTTTWWNPSLAIVVLWFLAIPVAGMGAWFFASRLTPRPVIRAFVAIGYALAPALLVALAEGRVGAVIASVLIPWLGYSALRAVRSWSASATTAILFAVILACAPSLGPVLILLWIGALALTGRYVARFLAIPIPAAIMFAPLIAWQIMSGNPLGLLADPGATVTFSSAPHWQLLLGFPTTGLGGWQAFLTGLTPSAGLYAGIVTVVLVAVVAALAIAGLFSPTPIRAQLALLVVLFAALSAVAASQISVATSGSVAVALWPGSALSVGWLALLVGAASGIAVLRRFAVYPAIAGLVCVVLLAVPLGVALFTGRAPVKPSDGQTFPAYVVARAMTDERMGTLLLAAQPDGGLAVSLQRGFGASLDNSSTVISTQVRVSESGRSLAELAGNLSSLSSDDSRAQLREWGIGSILLAPVSSVFGSGSSAEAEMFARVSVALDANPQLAVVGHTAYGTLWRFADPDTTAAAELTPRSATEPWRTVILIVQILVIAMTLLLAIPTGMPQQDIRPRRAIAGLELEPNAFESSDPLQDGDDDDN